MEKFLVKIDLDSIRKNPDAFETTENISTGSTTTIRFKGNIPDYLVDGENWIIVMYDKDFDMYEGIFIVELHPDMLERMLKDGIHIETDFHRTVIHHFQNPEYLYEYEDNLVKCNWCGAEFSHKKLQTFDNDSEEDYCSTNSGCPDCKTWDCCDIEYEDIKDALKRKINLLT